MGFLSRDRTSRLLHLAVVLIFQTMLCSLVPRVARPSENGQLRALGGLVDEHRLQRPLKAELSIVDRECEGKPFRLLTVRRASDGVRALLPGW